MKTVITWLELDFFKIIQNRFLILVQKRCNLFCLTKDPRVKQKNLPEMAAASLMVSEISKNVKQLATSSSQQTYPEAKHEKTYSGENSNKCSQCYFESSNAGNLKGHMKLHSGEKPNKCNQCDFASSYASSLRDHLKTHSGEKAHKCSQCDYASSHANHLRTHLKTHSGEKSNKCNHCALHPPRQPI